MIAENSDSGRAIAEIEEEILYPLTRVADDIRAALDRKSFHDRIAEKLADDPDWESFSDSPSR